MALQPITNTQVVALQLEKVRKKLPVLYERADNLFSVIQKREVMKTSNRNARIPLQAQPGGAFGFANFDGGDLGLGSGTNYQVAQLSPVGLRFAVQINKLVEYATNSSEKAVADATKKEVANAMAQFRRDLDAQLQTAGNAVMGTVNSVAANVFTMASTPFGARLARQQMKLQVYDTTLTTNRGSFVVTDVQSSVGQTQTITGDSTPAGTVATDVVVADGLSGASPVGLFGIPYHHNASTSGTWLSLNRSNVFTQAVMVNANSSGLALPYLRLAVDAIMQNIGIDEAEALKNLLWFSHRAQKAAYHEIAFSIATIQKGKGNEDIDLLFGGESIGGIKTKWNIHADPTALYLLNLDTWGRVEWKEIDYFEIGGNTVFPVYGASGGIAAAYLFYLVCGMQYFVDNPRAISGVTSLAVPAGY